MKHVAPLQGGYAFKSDSFGDEGIPIVKMNNLKRGRLDLSDAVKVSENDTVPAFALQDGDLVFGMSGSLGETGSLGNYAVVRKEDLPCQLNQRVGRFIQKENCTLSFVRYFISSNCFSEPIISSSTGTAQSNISSEQVGIIPIPLPPLPEQRAIADFLDRKTAQIDDFITKKQRLIELLKEERTALINEAVSGKAKNWERKKLKYVADLRDELIDDSDFKIAVENIESATGRLVNMEEEKKYEGNLSAFKKGDTIFNKLRPYLHKVYLAQKDGGLFGELLIIYSKGEIIPEFLFFKLFSKEFIDIVDGATQGTKMPRANWDDFINQLVISFPRSMNEQTDIVRHIMTESLKIDNTIATIEKEIELIQEYRTALISEAVTGKIDVRDSV